VFPFLRERAAASASCCSWALSGAVAARNCNNSRAAAAAGARWLRTHARPRARACEGEQRPLEARRLGAAWREHEAASACCSSF
jgi:hypothetical protein